jgi:hypothetical protein
LKEATELAAQARRDIDSTLETKPIRRLTGNFGDCPSCQIGKAIDVWLNLATLEEVQRCVGCRYVQGEEL